MQWPKFIFAAASLCESYPYLADTGLIDVLIPKKEILHIAKWYGSSALPDLQNSGRSHLMHCCVDPCGNQSYHVVQPRSHSNRHVTWGTNLLHDQGRAMVSNIEADPQVSRHDEKAES